MVDKHTVWKEISEEETLSASWEPPGTHYERDDILIGCSFLV